MLNFFRQYGILAVLTAITLAVLVGLAITGGIMGWDKYYSVVHVRAALPLKLEGFLQAPWTLVTHPFVTMPMGFIFVLFQLLLFWSFGWILRGTIGEKKMAALILVSIFILPILVFALCAPMPFIQASDLLYGLDMAVMALVGATITLLPGMKVRVFFLLEVKIVWLGLLMIAAGFLMGILSLSHYMFSVPLSAGFGWLYVIQQRKGRDLAGWILFPFEWRERMQDRKDAKAREQKLAKAHKTFKVLPSNEEEEVNRILDKISSEGYDKLTRTEKEFLDRHSRK